jgi:hypothetical protein
MPCGGAGAGPSGCAIGTGQSCCANDRCDKRKVKVFLYSRWGKNCKPTYAWTTRVYLAR